MTSYVEPMVHSESTLLDFCMMPNHASASSAFLGDVYDLTSQCTLSTKCPVAASSPFSTSPSSIPVSFSALENVNAVHSVENNPALPQQDLVDELKARESFASLSITETPSWGLSRTNQAQPHSLKSVQHTAYTLHQMLSEAKVVAFEAELQRLGFCEVEDLIEAPDSGLIEAGLKSAEVRRLHRYLQGRGRCDD